MISIEWVLFIGLAVLLILAVIAAVHADRDAKRRVARRKAYEAKLEAYNEQVAADLNDLEEFEEKATEALERESSSSKKKLKSETVLPDKIFGFESALLDHLTRIEDETARENIWRVIASQVVPGRHSRNSLNWISSFGRGRYCVVVEEAGPYGLAKPLPSVRVIGASPHSRLAEERPIFKRLGEISKS